MKAHKFKSRLTTQDEVRKEFYSELYKNMDKTMFDEFGCSKGALAYAEWRSSEEGIKKCAEVTLDLIKEWESKGRNMAFLKNEFEFSFMNLISKKHTGKSLS